MSIDMQQFNAVFFEEVSEHLTNMESLLLAIDVSSPNIEDLNAIFRAAHSIKGGAGIFGFDDMTEVTHILETLLDRLRKEELLLTAEMIDAFLQAGDLLAEQKEVHQEGGEAVEQDKIKNICLRLEGLSSDKAETLVVKEQTGKEINHCDKDISFLSRSAEELTSLFEELSEYGQLTTKSEKIAGFTKWQLLLSGCSATNEELIDSISFLAESDTIFINDVNNESGDNDTQEDSFGLFEDDITSAEYGLFDDIVDHAGNETVNETVNEMLNIQEETEAFGFFENSDFTTITPEESNEEAFGLFSDDETIPAASEIKNQSADSEAYGLFEEKEEPAKRQSPPAASEKKVAKKAISSGDNSIRVNTEKVDQLINQVGELVITQAMLTEISNNLDPSEHDLLLNRLTQLERNTRDLQESVMSIRMMPISFVFGRFPRVVRDLSNKLNKKIELKMVGDETELDKALVEKLADPLTHLIRNSIDHGIEMPEERLASGKPEMGTITLFAFYEGGNVVINISDDGAGLNRHKILEKAHERGLDVNESMSDNDVYQLIFSAGFSTAETVTDVSGRGVGMDVVKRNIHSMGGQVEIHSEAGIGSTISIRLPLTLAILDGMSISVAGQIYIIPLTFISESLQPQPDDIKTINGKGTVVKVREEYIPMLALHQLFNIETEITKASDGILVLLEVNHKKIALLVDQLEGQQQVVLKSLETNFRAIPCISGATIMGDGKVALILDVAGLVDKSD